MRSLHALLMLLGALSVLMLGAVPASAMTRAEITPPCHEMSATQDEDSGDAPAHTSGKALAAMACCVSCVVAPALSPPPRTAVAHPDLPGSPPSAALPIGLSPSPEHGPPRV